MRGLWKAGLYTQDVCTCLNVSYASVRNTIAGSLKKKINNLETSDKNKKDVSKHNS